MPRKLMIFLMSNLLEIEREILERDQNNYFDRLFGFSVCRNIISKFLFYIHKTKICYKEYYFRVIKYNFKVETSTFDYFTSTFSFLFFFAQKFRGRIISGFCPLSLSLFFLNFFLSQFLVKRGNLV